MMIKIESDIAVWRLVKSEIPVTPPSIKPLGIKNPRSPKPAEITPRHMVSASRKYFLARFFKRFLACLRLMLSTVRLLSGFNALNMILIKFNA